MFNYNSNHKFITGIIIVLWAAFHFTARDKDPTRYENGRSVQRQCGERPQQRPMDLVLRERQATHGRPVR
ncbi:MAG: hypothetical protein IPI95_04480 [Flavobacteriales bacterium]|nr:hypothetical protein [Flavobacteriales bacterium]